MDFTPSLKNARELIALVDQGKLALPEFQRKFRWGPDNIADYLRTAARNWPGGSFLLLAGPHDFAAKALAAAPALSREPELLILDGQQRMTSLYQALTDQAEETYFLDLARIMESGAFDDEHLRYLKKTKFRQLYATTERMAKAGIIPVHDIGDDALFLKWTRYLADEPTQEKAFEVRDALLPGMKAYSIPCIILPREVPITALAKIFETINKTGMRLDAFDLMVAKLYPERFHLRDEWERAKSEYPAVAEFYSSGIEVLKLIALREHLRQAEARRQDSAVRVTVKGVRETRCSQRSSG